VRFRTLAAPPCDLTAQCWKNPAGSPKMIWAAKRMSKDSFPSHERIGEAATAQRVCPICGGALVEIHCVARCTRCHALIDICCEGTQPVPPKPPNADREQQDRS
jgi:hypothetical protein